MYLKKFNVYQQEIINNSLADGIDPSSFAKPHIDQFKMQVAAHALDQGINLSAYLEDFDFIELNEIRLAIKSNLNVAKIAIKGLSCKEMHERRLKLMKTLPINLKIKAA
ncbi:hypothetical protein [Aquella oligotrophica]|uniref:Uncharacterized protein n=1 Tax=Aquella oligotrophica TaxID=2067065 RepID=A0A2I7N6T5_9NEIS|nr:hypothetical protein [Aquella oligotrophica]AUR52186.1 hypothetical protein CUN60_07705 [Aquella oligotrophica]